MNARLDVLLRQRELLRQHAQWLDAEITAARHAAGLEALVPPTATPVAATAAPVHSGQGLAAATASVETAMALPEPDIKGLHGEVRRGCMMYFTLAAGVLGAVIALIYWRYS